jgi:glutamate-ammonia-ligase adenylyltransferase
MGGEELNYSSDIDLMFLYSANGETSGPAVIANKEFFKRASNQLTSLLSAYSAEGLCYRVDLRLRPDGSLGEVCHSLEGAMHYYAHRARDWELQMLIKARVAAGHAPTGRALLEFVEPRIYTTTLDFSAVEQLSATRERLNERLAARAKTRPAEAALVDVKLERGGIRDIEFLVQCLQRLHGGAEPWVQHRGTLLALARLHDKGVLKDAEYGRLASAYQFLRNLEHRLQFDEDRQTHALPRDPEALELVARRMPGGGTAQALLDTLRGHFANVLTIYERVVHARPVEGRPSGGVLPTLDQRAPALAAAFKATSLARGRSAFEHFLERLSGDPATMAKLDADPECMAAALDLFEHSPYFAEELIRRPAGALYLTAPALEFIRAAPVLDTPADLRRWYRRGILRLEAESVCRAHPVFDTLAATSELAETVIRRAYEIAIGEVREADGPSDPAYAPGQQMSVIALGRLGLREFDLGSDADLTFVLPDADAGELGFWTRVAERLVRMIGSYTGEGTLFTVDTRLRPNGSSGALVQTEGAVIEYFRHAAEAWESITYLKSRGVAGDLAHAEAFLNGLQQVYFERYGKAGSSRVDLREMRARLERELGQSQPLRAGRGGYYDIDFLLLYLRLKSAGVFYTVLNTPERIAVLEGMGLLSADDAAFLREAATFYRALDHGLRVISGHAEERLPKPGARRDMLEELMRRWTPVPLAEFDRVRRETRAMFDRYFL